MYHTRSNLLIVTFAEVEEESPCLDCREEEGEESDEGGELTGGFWAPFLHHEALLLHCDVLILPHPPGEEQAFTPEITAVLRQRHHGDEAEQKSEKIQDALSE
ncbi:hypothetical protein scyTo_0026646 [Scyliorhinus torazame]|uniref:Uncharacterized protein n=1 Tax=Scyliorhinus torazame TaxID=75743 RepID=A0A401QKL9_SCYTO|nr:hypothetical protein [Scyliorhinus torazame]